MRASSLSFRRCRKALCSFLSWTTLTVVLIAGSSFIFALLLPVARDVAHSIDAARRSKIEKKAPSMSDDMASQPTAGMAATSQWGMFWIDPPRSEPPGGADDSSDVDVGVTRVR